MRIFKTTFNKEKTMGSITKSLLEQGQASSDLVRAYLQEIGRVPLLTQEQEIIYGKQVQRMMALNDAKALLAQKLKREPDDEEWAQATNLSLDELSTALTQGQRAKRKMIEANLRLVVTVAKKYQRRGLELLDLIQEGTVGIQRGIEKFDPAKGWRLSTYAHWWIRQGITRAIAQQARMIRLPIHITEKLNKIKKAQRQLVQELGRIATTAEVADILGWAPQQVQQCLRQSLQPTSLEVRIGQEQDTELGELLLDTGSLPQDFVEQSALRDDLEEMLAELSPQQQQVLKLRFGLNGEPEHTLAKAGERLGVSRERARQLERDGLKRLREHQDKLRLFVSQ